LSSLRVNLYLGDKQKDERTCLFIHFIYFNSGNMAHRTHAHRKTKETHYKKREGIYKSTMACIAQH